MHIEPNTWYSKSCRISGASDVESWILSWALKVEAPGVGGENDRRHSKMACGMGTPKISDEKYQERYINQY